ncbi:M48 family metallopeptidase [Sphingomonas sp. So64.6b]|uniref:M48 family metallopeptidase n=1 Tax=Sphingomonas sp. So64.6b TaxID=2997354 RepID=UPI00160115C9|nr:M48 family metallopeptidase [Sphingomonas sp. So64.6b]QNA85409.1 M48 family metallopeptidase [Sphingomonas sp. So64.6b]
MRKSMIWGAAGLAAVLLPTMAHAASPAFDVERATRAYLDLLQGPARAKSDAYFEGGYWLTLWGTLASVVTYLIMLATGMAARFRDITERLIKRRWLQPAIFAVPFTIAGALIILPWTIYTGFFRERQYGLMNQGFGAWLGEQAIGVGVGIVVNMILFAVMFAVIRRFPRRWWLLGAAAMTGFVLIAALVAPLFIMPLFNKYTEMPAGPLRDRIVAVAAANHIPADHIYVSDASKQSKRISANVSGLGPTIRITLNDNLLNRTGPDEVVAVMGHEMGHYVLNHVQKAILAFAVIFLVVFFLIARIAPALVARYPRWGVRDVADPAAAAIFMLLASVAGLILTPVQNTLVRVQESEADAFGLDAAREPDGFAKVAMRLSEYRKIEPGPAEEALFFDHPSGATRVRMSMQWKKDHVPGATMIKPDVKFDQ